MRMLSVLVALTLPSLSHAKRHHDPHLAYVEDEPMAPAPTQSVHRDPNVSAGTRMDAAIRAPEVGRVAVTGEAVARMPSGAIPERQDEGAASGDAINDLVARQMRKNQPSIDGCLAEAVRRHPTANGTVQLAVVVADKKVKSVHVTSDSAKDIDLDACLVKAGLGWKLQLAAARFTWPVTVSPSASR